MSVSLPILRLPISGLHKALKQMNLREQICLSVLSEQMKAVVSTVNGRHDSLKIFLDDRVSSILTANQTHTLALDLTDPTVILRNNSNGQIFSGTLEVPGFNVKKWIDHVASVFFHNKGVLLNFKPPQTGVMEQYVDYVRGLNIATMIFDSSKMQTFHDLHIFPQNLEVYVNPIESTTLSQNFQKIKLFVDRVTLNAILMAGCSVLKLNCHDLSGKDINVFLKHWIRGSNPHLEFFRLISLDIEDNVEAVLMEGIDYKETQEQDGQDDVKHFHNTVHHFSYVSRIASRIVIIILFLSEI